MGTLSPYPWDLSLCGKNGRFRFPKIGALSASRWSAPTIAQIAWGDGPCPSPPFPRLSRRSGRIPALPYPPPSCDQYSWARDAEPNKAEATTARGSFNHAEPTTQTSAGISLLPAKNGLDFGVHFRESTAYPGQFRLFRKAPTNGRKLRRVSFGLISFQPVRDCSTA